MGSLDKYCRLCATNVRPDTLVKLFAETNTGRTETNNVAKLRNFLQFSISAEDRLPKSVCVQCITNLDYCIQFVDRSGRIEVVLSHISQQVLLLRCRRIETLLQRGVDVDYVASEADFRYTYLFPSPYSAHDNRGQPQSQSQSQSQSQFPEYNSQCGNFFPGSASDGDSSHRSQPVHGHESRQVHQQQQKQEHHPHPQYIGHQDPAYQNQRRSDESDKRIPSSKHDSPTHERSDPQDMSKTSPGSKVSLFNNDVSVDEMVVEIEPEDLIPRKSGNVKAEYPWKVGGATRKGGSNMPREKRTEYEKQEKAESPCKKMRTILPKTPGQEPPMPKPASATPGMKPINQIMIPVTLKTPCKDCNKMIVASSLQELKNHICEANALVCEISGCGRKFTNRNSFQYHQKHCHTYSQTVIKKDVDIMSIATNELVGAAEQKNYSVEGNQGNFGEQNSSFSPHYPEKTKSSEVQLNSAGKKMFVCPYAGCSKSYNVRTYLIQHERTHTGQLQDGSRLITYIFVFQVRNLSSATTVAKCSPEFLI